MSEQNPFGWGIVPSIRDAEGSVGKMEETTFDALIDQMRRSMLEKEN